MLVESIKENFSEIILLLKNLDNNLYITCHEELSNATIGEHTRHIIEMYQTLLKNYDLGVLNYDKRERDILIQTDVNFAIENIMNIKNSINKPNKNLVLQQGIENVSFSITSNYERELLYNLEHSIHHQALIKVALLKYPSIKISENFGVAKSTIEYRKQCVQ